MAAEWLESHMGQAVPEWQPAQHEGDHQLNLSVAAREKSDDDKPPASNAQESEVAWAVHRNPPRCDP